MVYPLQYLQANGIVHQDLNLENVLIDGSTGRIKITDFSQAMLIDALNQHSGLVGLTGVNSSHSPELIKSTEKACSKSDVFALGAILYQMAANKPPFSG